jgi:hypothetical protein
MLHRVADAARAAGRAPETPGRTMLARDDCGKTVPS